MIKSVLHKLCSLSGVSGNEDEVREYILGEIGNKAQVKTDNLGNILAFKKGRETASNKVLFTAHLDEVGLIITRIHEDGFLRFDVVGGVDTRVLIGKAVKVGKNKVNGVIGIRAIHMVSKEERAKTPKISELYIDIGAKSKEEALQYVNLGDYAEFSSDFVPFGEDFIKSKAIDDRFGCAALLTMIGSNLKYDTYFAFTVGEEVGLRGAFVAAYDVKPDIVIAVDATTAADFGDISGEKMVCRLNGGPVIPFMDRQTLYDRKLFQYAKALAEEKGIKWQTKTLVAGGNDAGAFQRSLAGIRVLAVSVPCRYIHTPSCVASFKDCVETERLLIELCENLGGESDV